ncbi:Cof-type HAD-IIB family hydrolase [Lapidilactobacillus wuchangensis]|uniref:Cof-type HAD-IIB family hydrolase n=1 Tax=Lapidilactobacillus wuchangensis TaxID=2486001 RepID=UPI000F7B5039|nr:HAD family hydrolase [Lapidilactobacillus wuchangensis]
MTIKLVAFDMDGTFLNDQNTYNHQRFGTILTKLRAKGIRVVSASGSQYQRLQDQFAEFQNQMDFVTQNGAVVYSQGQPLLIQAMPKEAVSKTLLAIQQQFAATDIAEHLVVGVKSAYVDQQISQAAYDLTYHYYNHLKRVPSLVTVTPERLQDQITSIGITFGDHVNFTDKVKTLQELLPNGLASQTAGFNTQLISEQSVNKARGLQQLQEKYQIANDEIMTFGDDENDLSMLTITPHGYAMTNAGPKIKAAAQNLAVSNNDEGVLNVMSELI